MDENHPTTDHEKLIAEIRAAIRAELQRGRPAERRGRAVDPRKQVIAQTLAAQPKITLLALCQELDRLQERHPTHSKYRPLPSWKVRLWTDAYNQVRPLLRVYVAKIHADLNRYLH